MNAKDYIPVKKAVDQIKDGLNNEAFDLQDLSYLIKRGELNLFVEFLNAGSPSPILGWEYVEAEMGKEFEYEEKAKRAITNPVESDIYLSNKKIYNISLTTSEVFCEEDWLFEYYAKDQNKPYESYHIHYWDEAWWVISKKELQTYIKQKTSKEEPPNQGITTEYHNNNKSKDELALEALKDTKGKGGILIEIWGEIRKVKGKEYMPNSAEIIIWMNKEENKKGNILSHYDLEQDIEKTKKGFWINNEVGGRSFWRYDKLDTSLKNLIKKYNIILK